MGEVYRVRDTRLNRDVAIKVLSGAVAHDPERRERFEREAQTIAALNHPNIVTIHAVERLRPGRGASPRDAEHVASGGGVPASGENAETTHSSRWNWSKAGRSPRSFHAAA
jgi:hypothetical protein